MVLKLHQSPHARNAIALRSGIFALMSYSLSVLLLSVVNNYLCLLHWLI